MIKKLVYIFIGLLLAFGLFLAIGSAIAGPKECPPGQDGGCNTYQHKETGKFGCFPDNADPHGWEFVKAGCDQKEKEKKSTPTPPVIIFPTATIGAETTITAIATKWGENNTNSQRNSAKTPTPTIVLLIETEDCVNSCMCLIVTQLAVANDLQRTAIANDAKACIQP